MKRIFLSGRMSGLPEFNYPAFNEAAAKLRAMDFEVENPAENPPQSTWEDYMRLALRQMLTCEVVAQLGGWQDSRGARMEHDVATRLNIPCMQLASFFDVVETGAHEIKAAAIDTADVVRHEPSGEEWLVACVRGDRLSCAGWPEGSALLSDCKLLRKAFPGDRAKLLAELAAIEGNDHRARYAREVLGREAK